MILIQNPIVTPLSITENITQYKSLSYNTSAYLKSTVFSSTGNPGTFTYQSINSYGTTWSHSGFHWEVDRKFHSLSSDRKSCKVTLYGHPEDANGVALAYALTANLTFYAN
ncbi:hypothetical protein [Lysinibacillus halotolerans]|uniref:Uncharacterized protein n=1 Tax=Lysinibacillus halotolerans TaxID=1368476 RepID=A0A3M8HAW9_9BACI|nr:hypothetical protein [Lysinibacillus halotolerans]RNC99577.1 hypothetical protein EC501_07465 [Lysinibacillus halotolerans]